ncbi:hypothetical protein [Pontibacter litorisediminis]|uniref:hypothetical protein n=1 Tax=Pontibacter litorisediminis TaxID=1846260 RepID=UPI0023EAD79B|nr:hypothetical protein [Pontibacter litorisediminis]
MAKKITPKEIDFFTTYYVAARTWHGLLFGQLSCGKMGDFGDVSRIVFAKNPDDVDEHTYDNILVVFKTEKGLHNWRLKHYPETIPVPKPEKPKLVTIGSGPNKLVISSIL